MAQIKSLKELADLGFVIAFRFYGRYPETGRSFYHPPPCESDRACAAEAASTLPAAKNDRRHSPVRRPGLAPRGWAESETWPRPSLSVFFATGTRQSFDGVLPSPAPHNVGAH